MYHRGYRVIMVTHTMHTVHKTGIERNSEEGGDTALGSSYTCAQTNPCKTHFKTSMQDKVMRLQ